jgi:hypothetical protein
MSSYLLKDDSFTLTVVTLIQAGFTKSAPLYCSLINLHNNVNVSTMLEVAEDHGLLDKTKELKPFFKICTSFLLKVLEELSIITSYESLDDYTKKMLVFTFKRLNQARAKDGLKMFIILQYGSGPITSGSQVITAAADFCERFNEQVQLLFSSWTGFDTASIKLGVHDDDIPKFSLSSHVENECLLLPNEQVEDKWGNVRVLFIDKITSVNNNQLKKLDSALRTLKNEPDRMYGGLTIVFAGSLDAISCIDDYTSGSVTLVP